MLQGHPFILGEDQWESEQDLRGPGLCRILIFAKASSDQMGSTKPTAEQNHSKQRIPRGESPGIHPETW